jgi:trimeric autotransporter adhesin
LNTTGYFNTFAGRNAGDANTTGFQNTFLGGNAGGGNTVGSSNTFVGFNAAGSGNTNGNNNTFVGFGAGENNGSCAGNNNTLIGYNAHIFCYSITPLTNSVAIGAGAVVERSNTIVLGTDATEVKIPGFIDDLDVSTLYVNLLNVATLDNGGIYSLCYNGTTRFISSCSSSIRYKQNIMSFSPGLSLINRLRPVTFDWKSDGSHDLGLVAEEVADVEPLLATYRDGQVEGVKYDRVGVVLVNAIKEQQAQIDLLRQQIASLKALLCSTKQNAEECK